MIWSDFTVNPWLFFVAGFVAVLGVGRLTRIVTYDDFPPAVWWRIHWSTWTRDGKWTKLFTCLWCFAPWGMLFAIAWLAVGLLWVPWLTIAWWIFWSWLGLSYLASILVYHDQGGRE